MSAMLVACGGGGGSDGSPPATAAPNVVELRAQVQQIDAADTRGFSEPAAGRLLQSRGEPLPDGTVITLDGKALKITGRTPGAGGSVEYATTAPRLAELFERLRISETVGLGPTRAGPLATVAIPRVAITPELGEAGDFIELSGAIESGQGTVVFDWSLVDGLKQAELSLSGRLVLDGTLGLQETQQLRTWKIPAGTISVPIPVAGYAVSFDIPVALEVTVDSEIAVELATYRRAFDFTAGSRYDSSRGSWSNLSRFDDAGSNFTPLDLSSAKSALQSLATLVRAQLLSQGSSTYTLARLTVAPAISPSLVLLKSVAAVGVRASVAGVGAVEASGVFPDVLSCLRVPLSAEVEAIGFYDAPVYDLAQPLSLLSPDTARGEFPLFTLTTELSTLYTASGCNDGRPYTSTITITSTSIPAPICAVQQNGVCVVEMFCQPGESVGEVQVYDQRWTLAAESLLAEVQSPEGSSEPYLLTGTYQPATGQIVVTEPNPFTEVERGVAPDGSTVIYYSGGEGTLNATFNPVTGEIIGTETIVTITRWNLDAREARCERTASYRSLPKP